MIYNLTPFLACSSLRSVRGRFFSRVSNFGFASAFPDLPFLFGFTAGGDAAFSEAVFGDAAFSETVFGDAVFREAAFFGSGIFLAFDDREGIGDTLLLNVHV